MPIFSTKGVSFNPAHDIPSLIGKVVLVTGRNSGLRKQSVLELSKHQPTEIWLAARSLHKAQAAAGDIKKLVPNTPIKLLELDVSSLDSVKSAAKTFCQSSSRLDILMLNAGIMAHPPGLTQDGYKIQFGTNPIEHAPLTELLLPVILKTVENDPNADARVISLSSVSHKQAPVGGILFDKLKTKAEGLSDFSWHGQSKLANTLFARELAKRYPQLKVTSVHPGSVATNLFNVAAQETLLIRGLRTLGAPLLSSVENGTKNQLWAATSKEVTSGEYYEPVGVMGNASMYVEDDLARKLWEWPGVELQSCS
ncbi:short-chain dehydrogenase/reductase [Thelonectria olida]|uniref:Short-chain dehydrogenase/reductase n=1 Tax=Thelonectria olida TaxID=1576542 RepID=A0A9P8VUM7_9HYPO|nr:short-chain dehydrogenase/reductase [Thelonectria olida]